MKWGNIPISRLARDRLLATERSGLGLENDRAKWRTALQLSHLC